MAHENKPAAVKIDLESIKLDTSTYAKTPIREDIMIMGQPASPEGKAILKQWELLNYLQKNLKTLDNYIQSNKGELFMDWITARGLNMSKNVTDKIGNHNNATGGISMYFLNLQNFYDQEEAKYDEMETAINVPSEIQMIVKDMRDARVKKRNERKEFRKIKTKNLKKDGKGYLLITVEEPTEVLAADASPTSATTETPAETKQKEVDAKMAVAGEIVNHTKRNIGIAIAGTVILVTALYVFAGDKK